MDQRLQTTPTGHQFHPNGYPMDAYGAHSYEASQYPPPPTAPNLHLPPPNNLQQQPQHTHTPSQPQSQSTSFDGKKYSLVVEQQPDRARMCGFGDKDRRPITPPPCVRLVIIDENTQQEVDYSEINSQFFVLQVDIWDENAQHPTNEVRHSNTSPSVSISMASIAAYPPPAEQTPAHFVQSVPGLPGATQATRGYQMPMQGGGFYGYSGGPVGYGTQYMQSTPPTAGQYQRNLIGSLSVSASQLADLDENVGFWFVLQDLSVRTEGTFRLRLSFMDISLPGGHLNISRIPILATAFTEKFTVYSAKKFPGVKESTELSKHFAMQGVKIPIRKDTGGNGGTTGAGGNGGRKRGADSDDEGVD